MSLFKVEISWKKNITQLYDLILCSLSLKKKLIQWAV